ncbi:helix-turn-helix domain-containing protein [Microbacterium sp. P05]|uniref:MmyB family transcriptional regulator n=1 Tax=Microbacterium sp. P05 TaxID=3366948 RepID=UPI0037463890
MDSPLGDFLRARRAEIRPEEVGIRTLSVRRVQGLRRDEVAQLAGISTEYYLRLERGRGHHPSDQVLRALARALRLDAGGLEYMTRLVRIQSGSLRPTEPPELRDAIESNLASLMGQWTSTPAYFTDRNMRVVFRNDLAEAILPGSVSAGSNLVLKVFSRDWRSSDLDWEKSARRFVSALRFYGDPHDPMLQDIVGLLSMRVPEFRRLWAAHEAAPLSAGTLRLDVAGFGHVEFTQQCLSLTGDENHVLTVLHAEPGSTAADAVRMLRAAQPASGSHSLADLQRTA